MELIDKVFLFFLGLNPGHIDLPRLGVELEVQLPATATAMKDLRSVCDLHHSLWHHQIQGPLSEARDQSCISTAPDKIS